MESMHFVGDNILNVKTESGPVDDVNWRVAPAYFVPSSSFVGACCKRERDERYLISILCRISFLFACTLRYHICPHFPSARLTHCFYKETSPVDKRLYANCPSSVYVFRESGSGQLARRTVWYIYLIALILQSSSSSMQTQHFPRC